MEPPLYVDVTGKIILPPDDDTTNEVIAVCHQGDLVHRSAKATLQEFRRHFTLQDSSKKSEESCVRKKCKLCLACIKTKYDNTVSRPMW